MMRKDVKLGFAIGGVLLAVLVVYVLVVSGTDAPTDPVTLVTGDESAAQTAVPPEKKIEEPAPVAVDPAPAAPEQTIKPTTTPSETPAENKVTDPFGPVASASDAASDDMAKPQDAWATALNSGNWPPPVMSITPAVAAPKLPGSSDSNSMSGGMSSNGGASSVTPVVANRPGPRINPELTPTTRPNPGAADPTNYIVQNGETFVSIAQAKYGNAAYYSHLIRANPNIDPRKLRPGMTIKVPPASEVKAVVNTPTQEAAAPVDEKAEYRIASGDSLYKISIKLYGKPDRADKIYEANKAAIGADPAKLKLGMVLKLPEAPTVK
jgi:nucleoid-associated protein YgaU